MELKKQLECFEAIKSLCTNYKKDSSSRKTIENLERRLTNLEELWEDFDEGHATLQEKFTDKTGISYFTTDVYGKTQILYETTKKNIMTLLASQRQYQQQNLTEILNEDTNETIRKLMQQQECNFKALDRAMSKIDVETLKEKWEMEENLCIIKTKWDSIDKLHWELEGALKEPALKKEY